MDHMKNSLDDLEVFFQKDTKAKFNQTYYTELLTCFKKFDDNILLKSQIAAWKG